MRKAILTLCIASLLVASPAAPGNASYVRPGRLTQVDLGPGVEKKNSQYNAISGDGRFVAFDTASALLPVDTNLETDVYLRDVETGRLWLASIGLHGVAARWDPIRLVGVVTQVAPVPAAAYWGTKNTQALSWDPAISDDGRYVAFASNALNLVPGDTNHASDVFVFDRKHLTVDRVSVSSNGDQGTIGPTHQTEALFADSWNPSIDAGGHRVGFTSHADDLASSDDEARSDVFVHEIKTGNTKEISVPLKGDPPRCSLTVIEIDLGLPCDVASDDPSLSRDGRFVAFDSTANNLVKGDTNGVEDVFVADVKKGSIERVSVASGGGQVGCRTCSPFGGPTTSWIGTDWSPAHNAISDDGRYVAFASQACGLIPSGGAPGTGTSPNYCEGIFVHDRETGRTERVSVTSEGDRDVHAPYVSWVTYSMSGDGRMVAFDAYPCPNCPGPVTMVYDRHTGELELTQRDSHGTNDFWGAYSVDINRDGRFVSFTSCTPEDPSCGKGVASIYLRDRGLDLGVGGLGGSATSEEEPPGLRVCVTPDICIPPGGAMSVDDGSTDVSPIMTRQGANLYGASLAYRPQLEDIYIVVELQDLPSLNLSMSGVFSSTGSPAILYGLHFTAEHKSYEVRGTSLRGGTFELFDCTGPTSLCTKVGNLSGGYGTTGTRIVFSVPLQSIGLQGGGRLDEVEAFTAIGTDLTGPSKVIDTVRLD